MALTEVQQRIADKWLNDRRENKSIRRKSTSGLSGNELDIKMAEFKALREVREGSLAPLRQQREKLQEEQAIIKAKREDEGFLKSTGRKVGSFLANSSVGEFGQTLGATADIIAPKAISNTIAKLGSFLGYGYGKDSVMELQKQSDSQNMEIIDQALKRLRNPDATEEEKARLAKMVQELDPTFVDDIDNYQKSSKQVIGEAIGTLGTIMSAGQLPGTGVAPVTATGVKAGLMQGAKLGAISGAKAGGFLGVTSGLSKGLREDKNAKETMKNMASSGLQGMIWGGVVGGAVNGLTGAFQGHQNFKAAATRLDDVDDLMISDNPVDEYMASKGIDKGATHQATKKIGQNKEVFMKTDKYKLAHKQGLADEDIISMSGLRGSDKTAARKMMDVARLNMDDPLSTARPHEVAGKTFLNKVKMIQQQHRQLGNQLDDIAKNQLRGTQLTGDFYDDFVRQLDDAGVAFADDGAGSITLTFKGSDFEGIPESERLLKNIYTRATRVAQDGFDAEDVHKFKRFLDNSIAARPQEGLAGQEQAIIARMRAIADNTLDEAFSGSYAPVNEQLSSSIGSLKGVQRLVGLDFMKNIDDPISNMRAGEVLRRAMGNASARPLQVVRNVDDTAALLGVADDASALAQVNAAEVIEQSLLPARKGTLQRAVQAGTGEALKEETKKGIMRSLPIIGRFGDAIDAGVQAITKRGTPEKILEVMNLLTR